MFWIRFKYNAEGRPFWISLVLCLIHYLLRHYNLDVTLEWQAKQHTGRWWVRWAYNEYRCHMLCEVPATGNVYRAECILSDVESHFFPNISQFSLLNDCVTNRKLMETDVTISNKNATPDLSRIGLKILWNIIYSLLGNLAQYKAKNDCTHIKMKFRYLSAYCQ